MWMRLVSTNRQPTPGRETRRTKIGPAPELFVQRGKNSYRRLLPLILRQWRKLVLILTLTATSSMVAALQPLPLKVLVDYALGSNPAPPALVSALAALNLRATPGVLIFVAALFSVAVFTLTSAVSAGLTMAWSSAGQRMVRDLAEALFHRLQRLSLRFHARRNVGDSLSRLTDDTWCIYTLASGLLVSPIARVLKLGAVGVVAWQLDPQLAALSFIAAPLLGGSTLYFGRRLKQRARLGREAQSRIMTFVHQTLTAIPIVQAFTSEDRNRTNFQRLATGAVTLAQRRALLNSGYGMVNGLVNAAGAALVLYTGGLRVLSGTLPLGTLLVFIAYMKTLQDAAEGLLKIYSHVKPVEASMERILEVLDADDDVREAPGAKPLPAQGMKHGRRLRFDEVTFGYEAGCPALQGINLEIGPGETVAIVGGSGAGKSTLASLILRSFDPWEGRVLLDGMDLRDVQLSSLRSEVAIMLQEPLLLPLSVAENIAYGRPNARPEEIVASAVAANADEFVRRLPHGYDTVIGERGATLSGGQRQRIAIARALLKDAPVLILDEPTSALDMHAETALMQALERLMEGRTSLIITHRLSTIRRADRVVVLDRGRVVEEGGHHDLLGARGFYHRLWALQGGESPLEVSA